MSWTLRIEHRSGYHYEKPVTSSYNEARMMPLDAGGQRTIESRIEVEPYARTYRYVDYWGTVVDAFDLHEPHDRLAITATAAVETAPARDAPASPDWDALRAQDGALAEFLAPTAYVPSDPELASIAERLAAGREPMQAVTDAAAFVSDSLSYTPGVTEVSTSAVEAFKAGHGVCQDYVHLTLALLRAMRVPARYVSGYFHSRASAAVGDTVVGESHAWVEAWLGSWWALDPTNKVPVGERHAVVGRGRDYADVPPLKGVYSAGASQALKVEVRVTRLA